MRIGIDARWIFPEISGIGAYTRELIRALAAADDRNEYVLFFDRDDVQARTVAETGIGRAAHFSCRRVPFGVFSPRGQIEMPGVLRRAGVDVYHSPNYMIPLLAFGRRRPRCVVTVHDVIPMIFPHAAPRSRKSRLYPVYRWIMREVGRRADRIISDSAASRHDVIVHLGIPKSRERLVEAIPCGVSAAFRPDDVPAADAGDPTILYVGRADPYKNLVGLVEAFAQVVRRHSGPVRLVIAGPPDPRYPEAERRAVDLAIRDRVQWTGYLDDAQLVRVYQRARVLAMPSLYEGFGLPVLEAMACGTPVVCSAIGALEELAGDAALLTAPGRSDALADALLRVLADPGLAADLRRKGLDRAARFTWQRTAERTLAVYEAAAREGRP